MGLYCHIDLSEYTTTGDELTEESNNQLNDTWLDAFSSEGDESKKGNEDEDEEEEMEYDDLDYAEVDWSRDPNDAGAAFKAAFMETATTLCPVRTGYLKSTIHCDVDGNEIECYADAEYAQYVEYGTSRMRAQPFFEPALEAGIAAALTATKPKIEQHAEDFFQQQVDNIWSGVDSVGGSLFALLIALLIAAILIAIAEIWRATIKSAMSEILASALADALDIEIT